MRILLLLLLPFIAFGQNGNALDDGAIIRRQMKDVQFLYHYGVMYCGKVIHFNQSGIHVSTIDEFSDNKDVKVISKGLTGQNYINFKKRYKEIVRKYKLSKYDPISNNCEHFVTELVIGRKQSIQADAAQVYVKDCWPTVKKDMLEKNPKSKIFVDLMDVYLNKHILKNDTINEIIK